jgi:hypothetical protein
MGWIALARIARKTKIPPRKSIGLIVSSRVAGFPCLRFAISVVIRRIGMSVRAKGGG